MRREGHIKAKQEDTVIQTSTQARAGIYIISHSQSNDREREKEREREKIICFPRYSASEIFCGCRTETLKQHYGVSGAAR